MDKRLVFSGGGVNLELQLPDGVSCSMVGPEERARISVELDRDTPKVSAPLEDVVDRLHVGKWKIPRTRQEWYDFVCIKRAEYISGYGGVSVKYYTKMKGTAIEVQGHLIKK